MIDSALILKQCLTIFQSTLPQACAIQNNSLFQYLVVQTTTEFNIIFTQRMAIIIYNSKAKWIYLLWNIQQLLRLIQ